jgi:hypothetical protein
MWILQDTRKEASAHSLHLPEHIQYLGDVLREQHKPCFLILAIPPGFEYIHVLIGAANCKNEKKGSKLFANLFNLAPLKLLNAYLVPSFHFLPAV